MACLSAKKTVSEEGQMQKVVTPQTLEKGQISAVAYAGKDVTIVVSNPSWDLVGDLSRLPKKWRQRLSNYSKNEFSRKAVVIDAKIQEPVNIPGKFNFSGNKVFKELSTRGYSILDRKVTRGTEYVQN